ncbi:SPOR domain-containing protein [Zobellella sp. DQSA1]|uniref:SPOR domain-containing protein n=1 Tax=Zobellella sp. DQSA1 TaxID=3342386 RepID=UPI0035C16889
MARDYVRRSKPKSNSRSTRSGSRSRAPERRTPWLAIILVLMLATSLGYLIYLVKGSAATRATPVASKAAHTTPPSPPPVNPIEQRPVEKWRYIEQLENKEVVVDVPKVEESSQRYLMQCGSFRSAEQAEQLKAHIAFQGLVAQVRRSEGSNGIWYRVILGPYERKRQAEQDKHKLMRAKVNHCAIWLWEG